MKTIISGDSITIHQAQPYNPMVYHYEGKKERKKT